MYMNKPSLFAHAANFAPGFLQRGRRTWIGFGIGLLVFVALLLWAALTLISWLWGQTQGLAGTAPDLLRSTAGGVLEQVKAFAPSVQGALDQVKASVPGAQGILDQVRETVPGARDMLAGMVPALKPETALQRDVSGEDLGPVPRYSGLMRTQWQRTGGKAAVEYEGKGDYVKVLSYYSDGFAAQGFSQSVQSAAVEAETHEYAKGSERFIMKVAQKPKNIVSVRLETAHALIGR
jgi:hypothetical protein